MAKISNTNAEKLHAEYFKVSAHLTARPSHAVWQGKVYSREQLVEVGGLGTGPGLLGWKCRHSYYPFIPGISKRTYTDEQLEEIYKKSTETTEWRGKEYTGYEATQHQRALERRMRVQDEKIRLMKPAGVDSNEIAAMKAKRGATYQEYKQFSEKMGLPEQMNRIFNSEVKSSKKTGEISTGGSSDSSPVSSSPSVMHYITPGSKKKSLVATPKSGIPGTVDITDEWKPVGEAEAKECKEYTGTFEMDGVTYQIGGKSVLYDYDDHEKHIGDVLAEKYGKDIFHVPRVNKPDGVKVPDFMIGSLKYELKTLKKTSTGKHTFKNAITSKAHQASNYIFDVTDSSFEQAEIDRQVNEIFTSKDTYYVSTVLLMRNDEIIEALKRA